jgi:hypothetical protein
MYNYLGEVASDVKKTESFFASLKNLVEQKD